jgi:hypothetical protein
MAQSLKVVEYLSSAEAAEIRNELAKMMEDPSYNTRASYSPAAGGDITFVDKHMKYLSLHLNMDPAQYLSNLRLITRYN